MDLLSFGDGAKYGKVPAINHSLEPLHLMDLLLFVDDSQYDKVPATNNALIPNTVRSSQSDLCQCWNVPAHEVQLVKL